MISIIIPVYNVEKYIARCISSVDAQTYKGEIECIIVDDCGKDNSIGLVEEYIRDNTSSINFRIIHHEQNRGLAAARNTGVECSLGDFVMHLDSDDWLDPNAVELLVSMQEETDADIVSGNAMAHYNDNCLKQLEEPEYASNMDMVRQTIQMTLDHVIWKRLIRKSLYIDNGIKAEEGVNIGEDHHTLPKLAYFAKRVAKVNKVVYHYNCMNPNSYMQMTKASINLLRYKSDSRSIQILKNFFIDKNREILNELDKIRENYVGQMMSRAISLGDKINYTYLCVDNNLPPHYNKLRLRYFLLLNKVRVINLFSRLF